MFKQAPCHGQTEDSIKSWLKANIAIGASVVIRNTHGGLLSYRLATVTRIGKGRFELDKAGESGGCTFYYSGKNCFHPKGQTRLVEPTAAVLAGCEGLSGSSDRYSDYTV